MMEHLLVNFNLGKLKRPSYFYSVLLITITFCQLISAIFSKYYLIITYQYPNIQFSQSSQIINLIKYLDVNSVIQENEIMIQIFYWWLSTQSLVTYILYGICYFQVKYQNKKNLIDQSSAKMLTQLLLIDQWITCQPTQLVYLNIAYCSNNNYCLNIIISDQIQQIIASCFLLVRFIFQIILILFFINHHSIKKDTLSCGSRFILFYLEVFRILLNILLAFPKMNQEFHVTFLIYLFLSTCLGCYLFKMNDFKLFIANHKVRQVFKIFTFSLFGISIGLAINSISIHFNITKSDNFIFTSLLSVISIIWIFYQFYFNQQIQHLCKSALTENNITQKIDNLKSITKEINIFHEFGEADSFYLGILYQHFSNICPKDKRERCFCMMRFLYDPKKHKDIKNSQFSMLRQKRLYLKYLIKTWFEIYLFHHPQDVNIRINYAVFLYYQMNNQVQSNIQIKLIRNYKMNILQQFDLCKIELQFQNEIIDDNSLSYQNESDFEYVIKMEQLIKSIEMNILNFLDFSIKFWRQVKQKIIYEEDLWNLNEQIILTISKSDDLWNQIIKHKIINRDKQIVKNFLIRRPKWQFLYNWYHLYVLNKKIKQSMLEYCDSQNMQQQPVDEDSGSDNQNQIDQFSYSKPFNYTSAIFHTTQSGQIVNISESTYEIFGFQQYTNINQLLPQTIIRNHQFGIEQFVQTGKSKSFYKKRKVLALNNEKYLMPCKKYLKWHLSPLTQIEYICMIRPIYRQQSISYILVNNDWEIDCVSEQIAEFFQPGLCLFLLCPKLLKYSYFSQFLTEDDLQLFKLKRTKNEENQDSIIDAKFTNRKITIVPTNYKNQYVVQQQTQDLVSMVLEDDTKIVEDSPIWINDALHEDQPEEKDQLFRRFHKVVDEDHVKLTFRLPKKIKNLIEDYDEAKNEIQINGLDQMTIKSNKHKNQRIIKRNEHGKLQFDKKVLFFKLFQYQEFYYETLYNHFKTSFQKYCMTSRMLKTVIKIEASIRFTKNTIMDKYQIIKITNLNIIESQVLDKKAKGVKVLSRQNQVVKQRQSVFQNHQSQHLQQLLQQNYQQQIDQNYQKLLQLNVQNSDVESYRNTTNKALISEDQVQSDFNAQKITSLSLKTQNNIFIKEENNKPAKQDEKLNYFKILNRIFILFLIIFNLIVLYQGPNVNNQIMDELGFQSAKKQYDFLNVMIESYDKLLNAFYFENNLQGQIINKSEFYQNLQKSFNDQLSQITNLYQQPSFVQKIYKSKNYDNHQNIIDLINQYTSNIGSLQQIDQYYDFDQELDFFRTIFIPFLFNYQSRNIFQMIDELTQNYQNQDWICFIIIMTSTGIFGFYLIYNIFKILKFITQSQKVAKQLCYIEKTQIEESLKFYINLKLQFSCICSQTGLIQNNYFQSTNQTIIRLMDEDEKSSNLKRQKYKQYEWSKRWRKIKVLMNIRYLFFMSTISFLSYFYFIHILRFNKQMSTQLISNQFTKQTTQLLSLTLSKELYIYNFLNETYIDIQNFQEIQNLYVNSNSDLQSILYQTDIDEIDKIFNGDLCKTINQIINFQYCDTYLNGALNYGLQYYNFLLSQMAQQLLNPEEGLYENTTIDKIFEFDQVNQFQSIGYKQAWVILGYKYSQNIVESSQIEIIFLCQESFQKFVVSTKDTFQIILQIDIRLLGHNQYNVKQSTNEWNIQIIILLYLNNNIQQYNMSFVEQKVKQLRPIRTQRTQSEYDSQQVKASPELWIQNVLKDEAEHKNVLKSFGIDKASLKTAGITQADRIYSSLFIYSQGVYNSLEELIAQSFDKKSIMGKLWKVFQLLTDKCKPQVIEVDQAQSQQKITINMLNDQFQSLMQIKDQDLTELQNQIKMRDETIHLLQHKLNLQKSELVQYDELIQERDKLFSQETKKRVSFESKINQIQCIFNQQLQLNESLKQKLQNTEQQIISLEQELDSKRQTILSLNIEIGEKDQRLDNFKCRTFDSELQVKILKDMNQQLENKCQEYEQKKQKDYSQIQQLNYQNSINQSQYNKLDTLNKQLTNNYEHLQQRQIEQTNQIQQKSQVIFEQLTKITNYETQIILLTQENESLKLKLQDTNSIYQEINQNAQNQENEIQQLRSKQSILSAEVVQLQIQKNQLIKNYEDCMKTYQELKKDFDFEQELKFKIEFDLKRQQDQVKQLESEKKQQLDQVRDMQKKQMFQIQQNDEKSKFQQNQIIKKDETIEELRCNVKILNTSNSTLEVQVASLTQNLNELQNKYSSEIIKKQELEQQVRLLRLEQKNLSTEYKKMEENLLLHQIKYSQIKDYPDKYKEINEQYTIALELVNQLQQDISLLKQTKQRQHAQIQTNEISLSNTECQTEILQKDHSQYFGAVQENIQTQTLPININDKQIQVDFRQANSTEGDSSFNDKIICKKQNQYTQVELITQTDFQLETQQKSIEQEAISNHRSIQNSQNFEDSYQTRLQPQYEDLIYDKQQMKLIRNGKGNSINKVEEDQIQESNKLYMKSKQKDKLYKGLELPQISNCGDKTQVIINQKTPSARFAKMYVQASEYYKK
ncbi:unnamed protein product [Paramecium sonneborni]|uniref:Mononegavirus-type SAM-dependent 2'-O-MTase domain-containing protein n=1 Tax=Paramecium sonneborni TaxID=65129 RepID=A0A8S1MWT5_9CILI|nr:unnamed protein product [Paramecium sonneborni]